MIKKTRISSIAFVLLSVIFIVSAFMISSELFRGQKEKDEFKKIAESAMQISTDKNHANMTQETSIRDLSGLFAANNDCIGWLCIPDTAVDYPVMHTPKALQKYLHQNFYGQYSQSGVPFLDGRCEINDRNLIIYGHNMNNGAMFSAICSYTDDVFCKEHPVVIFQIYGNLNRYKVFAVLKTDTSDAWYNFMAADEKDLFDKCIGDARSRSLVTTGITPEYGHQILTLSTCYGSEKNGRLLVLAVSQ